MQILKGENVKFSETICGMAFRVTDKKNATRGIGYIRIDAKPTKSKKSA